MEKEELKKMTDEIYGIGFNHGCIEMKNKILKRINRDWELPTSKKTPSGLVVEILDIINKLKVPTPTNKVESKER